MGTGRERLQAIDAPRRAARPGVVEAGQTAAAALDAQGAELRTELAEVRRDRREGARRDRRDPRARSTRRARPSLSEDAAAARSAAEAGDRSLEAMDAEVTFALKSSRTSRRA